MKNVKILPKKLENKQMNYQQKQLDKIQHDHESKKGSRLIARAVVDNILNITLFATVMKKKSQQQVINTQNYEM